MSLAERKYMEYKGYTITQSTYNNHIMICKDGKMVSHINTSKKMSDEELMDLAEFIIAIKNAL